MYNIRSTELESAHVWLYYIPFCQVLTELKEVKLPTQPPLEYRVRFDFDFLVKRLPRYKCCGVHLVMPLDSSSEDIPKVYTEVLADEDAGCSSRCGEGITPSKVKMKKAVLEVFEEDGYLCYEDEEVLRIISFQMCVVYHFHCSHYKYSID